MSYCGIAYIICNIVILHFIEEIALDDIPDQSFLLSEAENNELVELFEDKNDSILLTAVALVALVTIVVGVVLKQRSKSKNILNFA